MCNRITCAKCCTFYSIFGFWFLIIIGILLEHQPLYIKGVDEPDKGAEACYIGAVLYLVSMIVSVGYWLYHNNKNMERQEDQQRRSVGGVPTKYGAVAR